MTTDDAADAGDLQPAGDAAGGQRASLLDQLAEWSVTTQEFVRTLDKEYRRWSKNPPNSASQRRSFERTLEGVVAEAMGLETRLRDLGASLPTPDDSPERDGGDQAASVVYQQLVETHFLDAWRRMVRLLERQLIDIQEPQTDQEWREFFRRFDVVWRGAQELGRAAIAVQNLLDELAIGTEVRSQGGDEDGRNDRRRLLGDIAVVCGNLVTFLVENQILREDGRPPNSSKKMADLHIERTGGGGTTRLDALAPTLERYLDLSDQLIEKLTESSFLRAEGAGDSTAARLRQELLKFFALAKQRYEIASRVLHAALQMADPVFVAPREALHHAMDAAGALRDLAIQDQRFGAAVNAAEDAIEEWQVPARPWSELDDVEQAIIGHLRVHGKATREELQRAMPKSSASTVWRRLKALCGEGLVKSAFGPSAKTPQRKPTAGVLAVLRGRKGGSAGGSAPRVFQLTPLATSLKPGDDST